MPVLNLRRLWHPVHRCKRPVADFFELPCFPVYNRAQQRRILRYLRRHHRAVRGWIKVVLGQGRARPWATVKARMHDVLLRTDLWSDQILVLRAVQTLTMLDLQHNCELVWSLGGYTRSEPGGAEPDTHPRACYSIALTGMGHFLENLTNDESCREAGQFVSNGKRLSDPFREALCSRRLTRRDRSSKVTELVS